MIIPRHKICDLCGDEVGINNRYFIIKSKNYLVGYAGSCSDNRTHHICENCMALVQNAIDGKYHDMEEVDVSELKRPTGKWIGNELGQCSICGHKGCASDIWNGCNDKTYCPNCGALLE